MSINVYKPHVLVLPEDDANRQVAIGFLQETSLNLRRIQILPPSGGWAKVRDSFANDHLEKLRKFPQRHLILLIDFDGLGEVRRTHFTERFPLDVFDRVFLLGTSTEPEPLSKQCGNSFESIGKRLATECHLDETTLWGHALLAHNADERQRLNAKVKDFLFRPD